MPDGDNITSAALATDEPVLDAGAQAVRGLCRTCATTPLQLPSPRAAGRDEGEGASGARGRCSEWRCGGEPCRSLKKTENALEPFAWHAISPVLDLWRVRKQFKSVTLGRGDEERLLDAVCRAIKQEPQIGLDSTFSCGTGAPSTSRDGWHVLRSAHRNRR